MMKKVLFVFGTRPEAIKMAPVIHEMRTESRRLRVRVCVTAQHRGMLDDVLRVFGIKADHDLNIMQDGQTLEHITEHVIARVSPVLKKEKPDLVMVHGDTSTTFLTALAAFYQRIPIAHVEAGLRTYDFSQPFPEEGNRRLCDALCSVHFPPTEQAKNNLLRENIPFSNIFVTGNTVIDALEWSVDRPHRFGNPRLREMAEGAGKGARIVLVTAHRRENFGQPIRDICAALRKAADSFEDVRIVYPVHPNPNVKSVAEKVLGGHRRILLLPPLDYLDFSHLIKRSYIVVTDSGGLQEEAPSLGKPVLVLRRVTERPEAVRSGTVRIVGTDAGKIYSEIARLLTDSRAYERMSDACNPYGDGHASRRTVNSVLYYFGMIRKRPADFSS